MPGSTEITDLDPILEAKGLCRSVENAAHTISLLHDVSLEINASDRIGLVGPSGSGKSLLMRALTMLDPIDKGEVLWNGELVPADLTPEFRRNVCYVPQRMPSFEGTVRETLQLPFSLASWKSNRYDEERVVGWLEILQRDRSFLSKTARDLSGGESQLIQLILALMADPQVLLLDEPTSAMDSDTTARTEVLIGDWQRTKDRAYLWCSHAHQQVQRVAQRQFVMNGGRLGLH